MVETILVPTAYMNKAKFLVSTITKIAAFAALIITAATQFVLHQQQSLALEQQQQQLSLSNQTAFDIERPIEDLSFEIDNVTFSHHMTSVNGIQLHYVIGGQGDPVVLLHGWPQTWYEWRHIMPALAKNYTVIAPDPRGLGDSSKPITGYDGKTVAEDIHQLVAQLGFKDIFLVGHDWSAQTAYSYAATHPNNVSELVLMDFSFPGFLPPEFGENGPWWFAFHQTPNLPEALVEGKEREYISWFLKGLAYNPSAIREEDIDVFASHDQLLVECVQDLNIFELSPWMQSKIENQPRLR
jgi:hypothetical protein